MRNLRKVISIAGMFCLLAGVTACGSYKSSDSAQWNGAKEYSYSAGAAYETAVSTEGVYDRSEDYSSVSKGEAGLGTALGEGESLEQGSERKKIKTATLTLETMEFDDFLQTMEHQLAAHNAYLQYANVYGSGYSSSRRRAEYTVRVPQQNLNAFLTGMDGIATVVSKTIGEEDVTLSYVDMESRLATLRLQQERLLKLLEEAKDLEYIIRLEERLSEVRYQIESYAARLRVYDDKIDYSTVHIYVTEVLRLTAPAPQTVGERIKNGWSDTIYNITTGAQDFFVWFVVNIPYIIAWVVVITAAVLLIKRAKNKRKQKKCKKQNECKKQDEAELDDQK